MKRRRKKPFWKNFKFKYRLTITNENTLEEVVSLYVSKLNGLSVLLTASLFLFLIAACILVFTPLKNYLPGYMNSDVRREVVLNHLRADSLADVLARQNLYISNIRDILSGHVKADTVSSIDSLSTLRAEELAAHTREEEAFRQEYEAHERFNLLAANQAHTANGLIFSSPLRGVILKAFDPALRQWGVDIDTSSSAVSATLEGTVLLAAYTADRGYVIQIQHPQGFLSLYTHCEALLKKTGDTVVTGEAIALAGHAGTRRILHFELWHNGVALNPEKYVAF